MAIMALPPGWIRRVRALYTSSHSVRAPFLMFLTAYICIFLIIWFILLVIIHSEPQADASNSFTVQLTLAEMTLQLFMYVASLSTASLTMAWYADLERTKAARSAAAMVGTICKSAWLYTLWYSISTFYKGYNNLNWFCGGGPVFSDLTGTKSDWCYTARTVGVINVLIGAALIALWVWTIINRFRRLTPEVPISTQPCILPEHHRLASNARNAAHSLDISWRTVLTHPQDLEQAFIVAAYPHLYGAGRLRMNLLSRVGTVLLVFISIGGLLFTYPSISFSKNQGLYSWSTSTYTTSINTDYQGWGDSIIATNWYWLVFTLLVSVGCTAYADGRTHRAWAAIASVMAALNFLQFFSFWIYSARRAKTNARDIITTSILDSAHAQYAEIGGAGLIMINQLGVALCMFIRYYSYIRFQPEHSRLFHHAAHIDRPQRIAVQRDDKTQPRVLEERLLTLEGPSAAEIHVPGLYREEGGGEGGMDAIPSYNLPALTGVGVVMKTLMSVEVVVLFSWWVTQIVGEAEEGVLDSVTQAQAYLFNERMFMLCSVIAAASLLPSIYAERQREASTALATLLTTLTMLAAWLILVWPWAFQSISDSGYLRQQACDNADESFCRLTEASAVFAIVQGFVLGAAMVAAVGRVGWRGRGWDEAMSWESALLKRVSVGLVCVMEVLVWVWAFATVAATVRKDYVGFFQQWMTVDTSTDVVGSAVGNAFVEGYVASIAFLLLLIFAVVSWLVITSASTFEWQSRPTRLLTLLGSLLLAASTLPMLIQSCRFAQSLNMDGDERTFVAVFILMPLTAFALMLVMVVRCAEPLYRQVEQGKGLGGGEERTLQASGATVVGNHHEVSMADMADADGNLPTKIDMERATSDAEVVAA